MKVLNFGSLNIDKIYCVDHIVQPGETIASSQLVTNPGGKGCNQSGAMAKAGLEVYHAGKIGEDGLFLLDSLKKCHVDVSNVLTNAPYSGQAIIQLAHNGQNSIVLFPGANREITTGEIDQVLDRFERGDALILQNEINNIAYLIAQGSKRGLKISFNPSPFTPDLLALDLSSVDLFFINEIEAGQIIHDGLSHSYEELLSFISEKFPHAGIVLTVGKDGAYFSHGKKVWYQPIIDAPVVDTTAAGDTFMGYFIASLSKGYSPEKALYYATKASSITVSHKGALESIPYSDEVFLA